MAVKGEKEKNRLSISGRAAHLGRSTQPGKDGVRRASSPVPKLSEVHLFLEIDPVSIGTRIRCFSVCLCLSVTLSLSVFLILPWLPCLGLPGM
jgi:hypothetical protein